MFKCAGGCGGFVARDQVFCKGCQWTITAQYQTSVANRICALTDGTPIAKAFTTIANANATIKQPKIGYTTNPYFQMAVT